MIDGMDFLELLTPSPSINNFTLGTIKNGKVLFDGEETPSQKEYKILNKIQLSEDDRVLLANVGGTFVIMGKNGIEGGNGGATKEEIAEINKNIAILNGTGTISEKFNKADFNTFKTANDIQLAERITKTEMKNNPLEIGQWIDFHKVGSATDYDGRLQLASDMSQLEFFSSVAGGNRILDQRDYNSINTDMSKLARSRDARNEGIKTPQWYIDNGFRNQTLLELNLQSNVGLSGGAMCHVTSTIPWHDTSGIIVQIITVVDGTRYKRWSTSATTWSMTIKMLDQRDYDSLNTAKANKTGALSIGDENNILPEQLNILNYNNGGSNFSGVGGNYSGDMIFTVATSGAHKASLKITYNGCYINNKRILTQDEYNTLQTAIDGCFKPNNYGAIAWNDGNYTIDLSLNNKVVFGGGTLTIPANIYPQGAQITFINWDRVFTFVPANGVSIGSKDIKRTIDGNYASATLIHLANNTWALTGTLK